MSVELYGVQDVLFGDRYIFPAGWLAPGSSSLNLYIHIFVLHGISKFGRDFHHLWAVCNPSIVIRISEFSEKVLARNQDAKIRCRIGRQLGMNHEKTMMSKVQLELRE